MPQQGSLTVNPSHGLDEKQWEYGDHIYDTLMDAAMAALAGTLPEEEICHAIGTKIAFDHMYGRDTTYTADHLNKLKIYEGKITPKTPCFFQS